MVAPYEADAQLAYLSGLEAVKGGVVAVISEDSDLIAYGCPAVRSFTKFCYKIQIQLFCIALCNFNYVVPTTDNLQNGPLRPW